MLLQLVLFLLIQCLGAVVGMWLAPEALQIRGALAGMLVAGLLWVLVDFTRGLRVLQWLRNGDVSDVPLKLGLWGEVAERARRLVRQREQETRDSDRRLQNFLAALQASPNGVVLLDAQGRIEWFNQTAASHFGLETGRDLLQHMVNLVRNPAFTAYVGGTSHEASVVMQGRAHSSAHPSRISVHLHDYGEGRRLLLSRDVTMFEQAEAMRRDFVANVSHEIRTPLTVLSGFVETLQTLTLDATERARYLDLMAQQASRMQSLVSDLLMLSRLEGSPLPGAGEWSSLPVLTGQVEQEAQVLSAVLNPPMTGPAQCLNFEAAPPRELSGMPSELHSALSNLVSNAVRYTPAGGEVRCGWLEHGDGRIEFYVQDSGPGIAPEHIPRLTERFYRVDRSRSRDTGGTGLGLAIVKHVAQRHGAELRIESTPGKGSRFAIVFPASRVRPLS
ncbi:phosphate regulon sensor histidine kinase PhoR [Rhodoferax sp. BAB1]|uniref:phosphate regulon sensor histidine kinase PhoR n=1 Tax=Rhodoferax sp. BAB1 TaxID=2741720 RepID=UPI001576D735|nr:phosphate regulon sensor histidine kinase PhoR [Rhodoferax sp. BAB1]QKO21461.1 phosphate regulon sensor histidine kinase PhoR [Rhodoferax sp. BAB1]